MQSFLQLFLLCMFPQFNFPSQDHFSILITFKITFSILINSAKALLNGTKIRFGSGISHHDSVQESGPPHPVFQLFGFKPTFRIIVSNLYSCFTTIPRNAHYYIYALYSQENHFLKIYLKTEWCSRWPNLKRGITQVLRTQCARAKLGNLQPAVDIETS